MDIEIKIGREVEGNNALVVPSTCKKVSRRHATLCWHDGEVSIKDNESSNGTFVNGLRVAQTDVTENDTVWLGSENGGEGCYQVDVKKVFALCREAEDKARTDYSKEFESVKQAYRDYQNAVSDLKKKYSKSSQLPKLLASLIPAVIGLALMFIFDDPTIRIVAMSSGSVLSGVIGVLTMGKNSSANEKMTEEITELQIKYQKGYCCPKCGMKFPFTTHWKKLEADGVCPNPKCGAMFVKPSPSPSSSQP